MPDQPKQDQYLETPKTLKQRWENFWYHYKWHSIVALFLVAVILICTLQTCARKDPDFVMLYAGPHTISANKAAEICQSMQTIAGQNQENKEETPPLFLLKHYYIQTKSTTDGENQAAGYSGENLEEFDQEILTGQAILLFLSPFLYARVSEDKGAIVGLDACLPSQNDGEAHSIAFVDDTHRGIKLSSLPLYSMPGFSELPEDTILCLRSAVSLGSIFKRDEAEAKFVEYQALLKEMLVYVPPVTE